MVADKLSRLGQTIQTEWNLLLEVFQTICNRWHRPRIDLFATRFNNKLPLFVSLAVPDPLASAVDALGLPWEDLDAYAFHQQPYWAKWWRSCIHTYIHIYIYIALISENLFISALAVILTELIFIYVQRM